MIRLRTFTVAAIAFFIRAHNETLSVVAVRVSNPGRSPLRIKG
jgi:hypothetical protein